MPINAIIIFVVDEIGNLYASMLSLDISHYNYVPAGGIFFVKINVSIHYAQCVGVAIIILS